MMTWGGFTQRCWLSGAITAGVFTVIACFGSFSSGAELDDQVRQVILQAGLKPLDPVSHDQAKVELGRSLFFDSELSGNRDISCASCHHSSLMSGDARSLSAGTNGMGLGPDRELGPNANNIPRNAPEVFHRGQSEWTSMFWDSRVTSVNGSFTSPAGGALPSGLDSVLAVQAMFPVTSRDEMRGAAGSQDVNGANNELAVIPDTDFPAMWQALTDRLMAIPEYSDQFQSVFSVTPDQVGFKHAANAIAAFEAQSFSQADSAWDKYLQGNNDSLTDAAKRGALLFHGSANCASCHSGNLMTDQEHYNIGVPQLGPGKDPGTSLDPGRELVTQAAEDGFAFRTPPLRNVAATGPWMHNGSYTDLEAAVRHHLDPATALANYDKTQLDESLRATVKDDPATIQMLVSTLDPSMPILSLSDEDVDDVMAFLFSLTSPSIDMLPSLTPDSVPSGLPVDRLPPSDVSVVYDDMTGELYVAGPQGRALTAMMLRLVEGPDGMAPAFTFQQGAAAWSDEEQIVLANDETAQSFLEYRSGAPFTLHPGDTLGAVLPTGLSPASIATHLTAAFMLQGSQAIWTAVVRPVPEPCTLVWLPWAIFGACACRRRRRNSICESPAINN